MFELKDGDSDLATVNFLAKSVDTEVLEKAIDRTKLVPKIVTDKNGHQRKVYVKPEGKATATSKSTKQDTNKYADLAKDVVKQFTKKEKDDAEPLYDYIEASNCMLAIFDHENFGGRDAHKNIEIMTKNIDKADDGTVIALYLEQKGKPSNDPRYPMYSKYVCKVNGEWVGVDQNDKKTFGNTMTSKDVAMHFINAVKRRKWNPKKDPASCSLRAYEVNLDTSKIK